MTYDIMVIADLHWGVMDDVKMKTEYEFILDFLSKRPVDMIVIAGDYFDMKLYLNSTRTIEALNWFDRLFKLAKDQGVKCIRMFRGTLSHDADQMNVFLKYEESDGFFRLFGKCYVEESLPGLKCIYCPDEIIQTKDYLLRYSDQLLGGNDVGFFHGSFDVVLKMDYDISKLMVEEDNSMSVITSITFPINFFQKIIKYAWVGGHWHDGKQYENVYYSGSPTRWAHNEDEPKGLSFIRINTDEDSYFYKKILNPLSPVYDTYEVHPSDIEESLEETIDELVNHIKNDIEVYEANEIEYHIRIVVYEPEKTVATQNAIRVLKDAYASNPNVVIRVKSKAKKKEKLKATVEDTNDYSFIRNKSLSLAEQIYKYIKLKSGEEVPLDYIEKMVAKFNK